MPASLNLAILRTAAELQSLVPEWQELWRQTPDAKPFQRPEWLLSWWHHFSQPELCAVTLREGGQLVGLLPLYVYADPYRGERQLLLLGAGTSDYLDGLFTGRCTPNDLREALARVAEDFAWDVAHLTQLAARSMLKQTLADTPGARAYAGESCSHCPALPIADLPKKLRADVRYFRNAAIGRGKLHLEVADAGSCPAFLELVIGLHSAAWQERDQPGVLDSPAVLAWHREAVPLLQAAGCLRMYALYLETEPIAALYALIDPPGRPERTLYTYLIGHAPAHAGLKPGTLLTAMAAEHAHGEGVQRMDMLRGDEAYKKFWHVQPIPTFGFSVGRARLWQQVGEPEEPFPAAIHRCPHKSGQQLCLCQKCVGARSDL